MNREVIFSKIIPGVKRIVGISDISLWRKGLKKRIGKLIYKKKYTADDIIKVMSELGMEEGSVVCIHSSMMEFYNYQGTAEGLIEKILEYLGPEGTLMMPAFPKIPNNDYDNYVFDPKNDKTAAGFLAETFRKYPGVKRSNNVHHSVCAIGKYADYLIKDHTSGEDCWDKMSPWYRVCELKGLIFNLGLPHSYMGTFCHCTESVLSHRYPYWAQFFNRKQKFLFRDESGEIKTYTGREGDIIRKMRKKKVLRKFTSEEWAYKRISNLEIKVYYSYNALNKLIEFGEKGVTIYYVPSAKKFQF